MVGPLTVHAEAVALQVPGAGALLAPGAVAVAGPVEAVALPEPGPGAEAEAVPAEAVALPEPGADMLSEPGTGVSSASVLPEPLTVAVAVALPDPKAQLVVAAASLAVVHSLSLLTFLPRLMRCRWPLMQFRGSLLHPWPGLAAAAVAPAAAPAAPSGLLHVSLPSTRFMQA